MRQRWRLSKTSLLASRVVDECFGDSGTHRDSVVAPDASPGSRAVHCYLPESLNLSQLETIYKLQTCVRSPLDNASRSIAEFNLQKLAFASNRHIAEITDERLVSQLLG